MVRRLAAVLAVLGVCAMAQLAACATYSSELDRGQRYFEENENEKALAILRALERDQPYLPAADRGRYCYVRGMNDFRIGYRADARYWLALAKTIDTQTPGSLAPEWRARTDEALTKLNEEVYQSGFGALVESRAPEVLKAPGKKQDTSMPDMPGKKQDTSMPEMPVAPSTSSAPPTPTPAPSAAPAPPPSPSP